MIGTGPSLCTEILPYMLTEPVIFTTDCMSLVETSVMLDGEKRNSLSKCGWK